jgi:hypothetical protein
LFFRQNDASWSMGNIAGRDEQGRETWSARVNDRYVLARWSAAHPDNDESKPLTYYYEVIDKSLPVIEAPEALLESAATAALTRLISTHLARHIGSLRSGFWQQCFSGKSQRAALDLAGC